MAGHVVDVIVSLLPRATETDVLRGIFQAASRHGLGVLFGTQIISRLSEKEGEAVKKLARELNHSLVFTITSNPLTTDIDEVFREQLNPWREGAKPSEATLLKFLQEVWSIGEIDGAIFLVFEELSPASASMPRYQMNFPQFIDWITKYYEIDVGQREKGGAEGIFTVRKER